jgi:hypothetical protein
MDTKTPPTRLTGPVPGMRLPTRGLTAREARRLGEENAFKAALLSDEVNGDPKAVNRVLMMGCFRLAQFTSNRPRNRRISEARRERDLLRRDLSRGHHTTRVKRAIAKVRAYSSRIES